MSNKNLYSLFDTKPKKGISPIGYSMGDTYKGVLDALQSAKTIIVDRHVQNPTITGSTITRYHTLLSDLPLDDTDVTRDGYFYTKDGEKLYQAICTLKDYMSYPVQVATNNGTKNGYASVTNGVSNGRAQKTGITFPPAVLNNESIESLKESCQTCYIGVGISVAELGVGFFKTFFPDVKLSQSKIENLIGKGYLYAEVIIPERGNNAKVLHAKVTVLQSQSSTAPHGVFIPIPMLLLDDYSSLGSVIIDVGDGTGQETIGNGKVSFPLASSAYNHKTGQINGLTPFLLSRYNDQENLTTVKHKRTTLCSGGTQKQGRVRLYFDKQAATYIGSVSEQDEKQLYKGTTQASVKTVQVNNSLSELYVNDGKLSVILDIGHIKGYNPRNDFDQHMLMQNVAKELKNLLESKGIRTVIVDVDSALCPPQIVARLRQKMPKFTGQYYETTMDKERGATREVIQELAPDFMCYVSLHADAPDDDNDTEAHGGHVLYNNSSNPKNKQFAQEISKELATVMPGRDETVKLRRLEMLRITGIVGCLVECGFYTNDEDVRKMRETQVVPIAICNGIINWYNSITVNG